MPSFKKLFQMVNVMVISANGLGALLTFVFLSYIAPLPQGESAVEVVSVRDFIPAIIGTIALLALGGTFGRLAQRYTPLWYERLRAGEAPEAIPEAARREVLNFPIRVAATSLAMWFLASLFFGLWAGGSVRSFLAIALIGGIFTSALAFFGVDWFWRRVVPVFFPHGNVRTTRAFRLTVFARLLIVFLLSSIYPVGLIVALSLDRARQISSASNPEAILR